MDTGAPRIVLGHAMDLHPASGSSSRATRSGARSCRFYISGPASAPCVVGDRRRAHRRRRAPASSSSLVLLALVVLVGLVRRIVDALHDHQPAAAHPSAASSPSTSSRRASSACRTSTPTRRSSTRVLRVGTVDFDTAGTDDSDFTFTGVGNPHEVVDGRRPRPARGVGRRPAHRRLVTGRCFGDGDPLYEAYHDEEWGHPVTDERGLFERVSLEAFQSGLFVDDDPAQARRLPARPSRASSPTRSRASARATSSACSATPGSCATGPRSRPRSPTPARPSTCATRARRWTSSSGRTAPGGPPPASFADVPAQVPEATALAKALKRRLSLRRADHDLRRDAGLRAGQRPPRDVPCARSLRSAPGGRRAPFKVRALPCK